MFWGEGHACQSTDPHVILEVVNQHETSQCAFHESWTWGDGTPGEQTTLRGSIEGSTQLLGSHTYARPGTYKISVSGYVVSEEPGLDFICEAPPVEYTFTLLPGTGTGAAGGVLGVKESARPSPPVVSNFTQSHREWRAGPALARLARSRNGPASPVGTVFSFDVNEQTSVKLSFLREAAGRRAGGRCAPVSRKNRRRARCRLSTPAGSLSFTARPGRNRAYFQGRISVSQTLTPASYALTVTATNSAGQRSAPRSLHFTILR
ncbi:MAG TPA: hypothetical protein VLZ06_11690 [Solirubrobacteraceae bacterium]|nr:hypothetical protein [Solirubrobacteraceae bacterium]